MHFRVGVHKPHDLNLLLNKFSVNTYFFNSSPPTVCSIFDKGYRYGFNGKELDDNGEGMGGGGSTYDYGFRIYNPNLGKFLSVDPLFQTYPWLTPYQFAGNGPILNIDVDGLENESTQKNIVPNQTETTQKDNTNQQNTTLNTAIVKAAQTGKTPDGGTLTTAAFTKVSNFTKGTKYTVNGKEIKIAEGSIQSFVYCSITYTAQFNISTGLFAGYLGTDGTILSYTTNTLPDKTVGGPNMTVAGGFVLTAAESPATKNPVVAVIATVTTVAILYETFELIHNLKDAIEITAPLAVPIGGFVLSKQTGNQKSDEFGDKSDEWLKEKYNSLKGKLDKAQKALKQKLQKELKARDLKNKGKARGAKQ
jgi:RHS repeat-associated protein